MGKLLTIAKVADRLGWTPTKVRRYIASKRMPHVRIRRAIFVEEETLEQWIASHRVEQVSIEVSVGMNPELKRYMPAERVF